MLKPGATRWEQDAPTTFKNYGSQNGCGLDGKNFMCHCEFNQVMHFAMTWLCF